METPLDCIITVAPHVSWIESNGEIILVDGNQEEVMGLDNVGRDAFLRLVKKEPLSRVIDDLLLEYEVERDVLEQDLLGLLHSLCERNVISSQPPLPPFNATFSL